METPQFQERVRDALAEQTHIFNAGFKADLAIETHIQDVLYFPKVKATKPTPLARARYAFVLNANNEALLEVLDNHYNANPSNLFSKRG
jgi:hypothetical protein